jgi:hypothetical protein
VHQTSCQIYDRHLLITLESKLDYQIAKKVLRPSWLSEQARAYYKSARDKNNESRMLRAARLEEAVEANLTMIVKGEVTAYRSVE